MTIKTMKSLPPIPGDLSKREAWIRKTAVRCADAALNALYGTSLLPKDSLIEDFEDTLLMSVPFTPEQQAEVEALEQQVEADAIRTARQQVYDYYHQTESAA